MRAVTIPLVALGFQLLGILVSAETEKRLVFHLLDRYTSVCARPVLNASQPVPLKVGLSLIRIDNVNQEEQTFSTAVFLKMMWQDDFLKWDPAEYDEAGKIALKREDIWTPDIELFNAVDRPKDLTRSGNRVLVGSDGGAITVPYLGLTSSCPGDPDADTVTCKLIFGSWVYSAAMVDLQPMAINVDTDTYEQDRDWEVLRTSARVNSKEYDCCPGEKYSSITFSLTLKRRAKKVKQTVVSAAVTPRGDVMAAILAIILMTTAL